jgi:hypothetical protein
VRLSELIWVRPEQKYFFKRGWTAKPAKHELICPSGKINGHAATIKDDGDRLT